MKALLAIGAVALLATACGAGRAAVARPPALVESLIATKQPSVAAIVAARKRGAARSARKLLREFVPPPHAHLVHGWPRDFGPRSRIPGTGPLGKFADVHRFWLLYSYASAARVVAFEKAHFPAGFHAGGASTNGDRTFTQLSFVSPPRGAATRVLVVSVSQRPERTIVRADAQVVWAYPRSPREVVPPGVREIDVNGAKVSRRVTVPEQVSRIIGWFDRLPISPPGVSVPCPLFVLAYVRLSFRAANGALLASARVPARVAGVCDQIEFSAHGKPQAPLIDSAHGPSFASRLQNLLGVRFRQPRY